MGAWLVAAGKEGREDGGGLRVRRGDEEGAGVLGDHPKMMSAVGEGLIA